MAKGFGKRLAEAAAIMAANVTQGYGEGRLKTAMSAREEYQQRLNEERASVAQEQERGWRTEEAEKEREHDFKKLEKEEEFAIADEGRSFQNQLTLERMRVAGRKGESAKEPPADIQKVEYYAKLLAQAEGSDTVTEAHKLAAFKQLESNSSGGSVPAEIRVADELAARLAKSENREVTEQDRYNALKGLQTPRTDQNTLSAKDFMDMKEEDRKLLKNIMTSGKEGNAFNRLSTDEQEKFLNARSIARAKAAGMTVPFGQESQEEAAQPQAVPGVATSTQGDKPTDATPTGAGTQESPYVVETEAQAEWAMKHAPPGAYIKDVAGGRLVRKPIK